MTRTLDKLPDCVDDGIEEVWWFNQETSSWSLGIAMLMDFEDHNLFYKYTYWLPKNAIHLPEDIEYNEDEINDNDN